MIGCLRYGTGLFTTTDLLLAQDKAKSVYDCKERCRANHKCKIFHWNQESKNCLIKSGLPEGRVAFKIDKFAILGVPFCSDVSIIWPEFKKLPPYASNQKTNAQSAIDAATSTSFASSYYFTSTTTTDTITISTSTSTSSTTTTTTLPSTTSPAAATTKITNTKTSTATSSTSTTTATTTTTSTSTTTTTTTYPTTTTTTITSSSTTSQQTVSLKRIIER